MKIISIVLLSFFFLNVDLFAAESQTAVFFSSLNKEYKNMESFFETNYPQIDKNLEYFFLLPDVNYQKQFGPNGLGTGDSVGLSYDLTNVIDFLNTNSNNQRRTDSRRFYKSFFTTSAMSDYLDYLYLNKTLLTERKKEEFLKKIESQVIFNNISGSVRRAEINVMDIQSKNEQKIRSLQLQILIIGKKLLGTGIDVEKSLEGIDLENLQMDELIEAADQQKDMPVFGINDFKSKWEKALTKGNFYFPNPLVVNFQGQQGVNNSNPESGNLNVGSSWSNMLNGSEEHFNWQSEEWNMINFMQILATPMGLVEYKKDLEDQYEKMKKRKLVIDRYKDKLIKNADKGEFSKEDFDTLGQIYSILDNAEEAAWMLLKTKILSN